MIVQISYTIRKRILLMALFSILFVCFCYHNLSVPYSLVNADDGSADADSEGKTPEEGKRPTQDNVVAIFKGNCDLVFTVCSAGSLVKDTVDKFKLTSQIRNATHTKIRIDIIAVQIAIALAYIYILLYILKEAMRGEMTMEFWGKCFIVLMVTCLLSSQWFVLVNAIDNFGDNIITNASNAFMNGNTDITKDLLTKSAASPIKMMVNQGVLDLEESELPEWSSTVLSYWGLSDTVQHTSVGDPVSGIPVPGVIGPDGTPDSTLPNPDHSSQTNSTTVKNAKDATAFTELLSTKYNQVVDDTYSKLNLSYIISIIIQVLLMGMKCAIDAQIFFIALQLVLRSAFMPIAIVGVASEGMRGGALRYVKRYFALYLQEGIIIVIMMAFSIILQTILSTSSGGGTVIPMQIVEMYYVLTCYGAITAAISQSSGMAQEIMGD